MTPRMWKAGRFTGVVLVLLFASGQDPNRPAARFTGTAIPDPPGQRERWTPPDTKLPRFLVNASAALFDAGMADPRGCAYREVELGDANVIKTRGFVLPETPGEVGGRFAVGWDGVVYPVFAVGPHADLEADVRALTDAVAKARRESEAPRARRFGSSGGFEVPNRFVSSFFPATGPATVENRSPLKLCMLLRLGRSDLAERLFAAGTIWTSDVPAHDLTDYQITFLSLANEWAGIVFDRLATAHERGDDVVALDAARRASAFQKAVDSRAEAMGFERAVGCPVPEPPGPVSYVASLDNLLPLLADQERRATAAPRAPIPPQSGDPSARIAALIRDFDQIHVTQWSNPGSADPRSDRIVQQVIALGDPAVEPLLTAFVSDTRLTRSVSRSRGGFLVHPVTDAVYGALVGILKANQFLDTGDDYLVRMTPEGRKKLAAAMRVFWAKNRAVPLVERWYRALRDDSATPDRWLEAAAGLAQPANGNRLAYSRRFSVPEPKKAGEIQALKGDTLRSRHDPSLSDLMARRVMVLVRSGNPLSIPDRGLLEACVLAESFARWDAQAALPTLRVLMETCRERSRGDRENRSDQGYAQQIAKFTLIRARAGARAALDEYAAWVQTIRPESIEQGLVEILEPMWTYPAHPAIAAAARAMLVDPKSPWLPLVPREKSRNIFVLANQIATPLACIPEFRAALLVALADTASAGTAKRLEQGGFEYSMASGGGGSVGRGMQVVESDVPAGVELAFRACDYIAWKLSGLEGAPEFELYWPQARRDAAVAAGRGYLLTYGLALSADRGPGEHDFRYPRPHLRFPALERPATADDVRLGRAIFSLAGNGEVRVAPMPANFPIRARWLARKAFPIDRHFGDGTTRREYLQDGWVWQAEEVRSGESWERSYGFVGHATIARAPASEIEFLSDRRREPSLPNGLDSELELLSPVEGGIPQGKPVSVRLKFRNCRGVDQPIPTEFIRPADDGKPTLRRGLTLALFDVGQDTAGLGVNPLPKKGEHQLIWKAWFDPGDGSRIVAPTESFEAMKIDLSDWFAALTPGTYRVHVTFAKNSGLGEGTTNDVYFTIGDQGERRTSDADRVFS